MYTEKIANINVYCTIAKYIQKQKPNSQNYNRASNNALTNKNIINVF